MFALGSRADFFSTSPSQAVHSPVAGVGAGMLRRESLQTAPFQPFLGGCIMLVRPIAFAFCLSLLAASSAFAQWGYDAPMAPPMDMSALIGRQVGLQAWGDQMVRDVARKYYDDVQIFRQQTGYTGPMPSPVSTAQLQQSVRALQGQYGRNNAAWHDQSRRTTAAMDRYAVEAIRGQGSFINSMTGQTVVLPWGPNSYMQGSHGQFAPGANPNGASGMFVPSYGW